ncbi:phosphodiester glycosidase family protein [Undibacterium jejuense]|uniref:Phosphodiester glycosidase family protein n=1 Tax=Undibacterium jejuense TaxID=1344949 RepID=A0A923HK26_9BURK|nr:phosphodiester glycosidase family protein [Undibacterium jejuense]MBC3863177.1 phosphodiester glycosidase family protein [Undibacterium jejuense]
MLNISILSRFTCLLLLGCLSLPIASKAASIIDYPFQENSIAVCKVDLHKDQLQMFWRDERKNVFGKFGVLQQWLNQRGKSLVCATNAGIYEESLRPLGLYIENGIELRRLNVRKNAYGNFYLQPNGVFVIRGTQANIINTDQFAAERSMQWSDVTFATQSGPLLIEHGRINPMFSAGSDNRLVRNAICTLSINESALVFSRGPISFFDFAHFLKDKLNCTDALYLDGSVSRFYPGLASDIGPQFGAMIGVVK